MKLELTEKQLKTIARTLKSEGDIEEQEEPVASEPKSGVSDKQSGGKGYPEVGKWESGVTRGPANQIDPKRTWARDGAGSQITRGKANQLKEYVFNGHITTNGKFIILQDEVFDVKNQIGLGNIWESMDIFKLIFKETESDYEGYKEIQEGILNLPILENKETLYKVRDIFLEQGFMKNTWVGRQLSDAGQGMQDFGATSWEGAKKMVDGISKGEWDQVTSLLAKGTIYVLRKLKDALYTNVGMVVDAILVATGIGKVAQFVVWALIVGLDVYEISSGNYAPGKEEDPLWMHLVEMGCDIMALVFAATAGKLFRSMFTGLFEFIKKGGKIPAWFAKNPKAATKVKEMITATEKAPSFMKRAVAYLKRKWAEGGKFLEGIMPDLMKKFSQLKTSLNNLIRNAKGEVRNVVKAATAGGIMGAMGYILDPNKQGNPQYDIGAYIDQKLDAAF